jgi:RNA polymerase sigma-70 factor (ECF subfamily)
VLAVAFRILRDRGEAEDLMQEVFLEIYRDVGRFDPARGSVRTWILQYAYHRSLNRRKFLQKRGFYDVARSDSIGSSISPPEVALHMSEAMLRSAIEQLSERERKTIEMACLEGLTLREISERTEEALANTRNHYYRGLKKLRALLFRARKKAEDIDRAPR